MNKNKVYSRPLDIKNGRIELNHGSGGRAMAQLIRDMFAKAFNNEFLAQGNDGAVLPLLIQNIQNNGLSPAPRLVMATDCHVVSPLFFAGGDIGCLSVHGTINDVAMMGAKPLYLAAGFILEEGLPLADLQRIVSSMAKSAKEAGVPIVTGDTKVVEKGKGDGIFITTTGVGWLEADINLSGNLARAGDKIILSGSIGDHGMAIMSQREGLAFSAPILSDTASLHTLTQLMLGHHPGIRVLRDPTRGGLASALNEIAQQSACGALIDEACIPINPAVESACEFLGLDPLYVANEGKLIAICPANEAEALILTMRQHPLAQRACIIGHMVEDAHGFVQMKTRLGGRRMVDWLSGEQLPRIC